MATEITISLDNLTKRGTNWFARMLVPTKVQAIIGKSVLIKSTRTSDPLEALRVARPILERWRREIEVAKGMRQGAARDHIIDNTPKLLQHDTLAQAGLLVPLVDRIEGWLETISHMRPRQVGQYRKDVEMCLGKSPEVPDLQAWVDLRTAAGDSKKTIKRRLAAVRGYLKFLKLDIPKVDLPKTVKVAKKDQRAAFTLTQIKALVARAEARNDIPLAALIVLAAHSGCRLEEIATLTRAQVDLEQWTMDVASKTDAGDRTVPIHKDMQGLVKALCDHAQEPGWYLLHSNAQNTLGERGMAFGKRFGIMKTAMGHGPTLVFHSIRKFIATALHDAECPEQIAADIVGHEITTMTYGVYSSGTTTKTKRKWLEEAVKGLKGASDSVTSRIA